jgi:peptidoglycan hydrolase FlgJ
VAGIMAGVPGIDAMQGALAIDVQSLTALRAQAKSSPDAALGKAASQFEAMFMQMLLKSMRDSLPQDGMLDSEATRTYVGMLDQQLATSLSNKGGIGLADVLVKQLRAIGGVTGANAGDPAAVNPFNPGEGYVAPGAAVPGKQSSAHVREFVDKVGAYASSASSETGVPARFIAAQAALESNWGRNEIRSADGTPSYNLFGIKAGRGWTGKTVDVVTTEYTNGTAAKTTEKFRAYDSYAQGFLDYAQLLKSRYKAATAAGDNAQQFAQGLQQGGYATDPGYADKIARIINTNFSARA